MLRLLAQIAWVLAVILIIGFVVDTFDDGFSRSYPLLIASLVFFGISSLLLRLTKNKEQTKIPVKYFWFAGAVIAFIIAMVAISEEKYTQMLTFLGLALALIGGGIQAHRRG